jgi:hypothetical protein
MPACQSALLGADIDVAVAAHTACDVAIDDATAPNAHANADVDDACSYTIASA